VSTGTISNPANQCRHAFIESFNSRLRDECLNEHVFLSLAEARQIIETWRQDFNHHRPHSSLGYLAPEQFAARNRQQRREAAARTAWPANEMLAGAVQGAPASVEELNSFSPNLEQVKAGAKNCNRNPETARPQGHEA
jgi:Integrase core domain